jgi:MoxR-like ATPase
VTAAERIARIRHNLCRVIVGKAGEIDTLIAGLLAGGHVLLDDIPGVGKTTLAKALARSVACDFSRIQFTPDLLPTDIVGASIYSQKDGEFHFKPGPIFTNILLADEVNRASPRTQSALLEAMGERQVTVDGHSRPLAMPFFVIATQNPVESHGTYPLPEAQLDRFAVQLSLGYPPAEEEKRILFGQGGATELEALAPAIDPAGLVALQHAAARVHLEDSVADYLLALVAASRTHPSVRLGASPRGALALLAVARAHALAAGRDYVTPDDVKRVAVPALAHRLVLDAKARYAGVGKESVVRQVLERVPVPR